MISKKIWQTHEYSYEEIPKNFLKTMQTWKNLNPEWEHFYVNAQERANQVKDYDQTLYEYYLFANNITQADIWRYIVIYQHGGVYADMDSICTMPLDYMINADYNDEDVISPPEMIDYKLPKINNEYQNGGVNNSNFAGIKNSKIMKLIIEDIITKYKKITLPKASDIPFGGLHARLWLGYRQFSDIVMKNKKDVWFHFEGYLHSKDFKESFDTDYINNYGE